jgi:chromate transport protein ChrA
MQTVAKRDAATLLPIIQKVVWPGSIVYSYHFPKKFNHFLIILIHIYFSYIAQLDSFYDILVALKRAVVIFLVDVVFRMSKERCSNSTANHPKSSMTWLHCLLGRMACLPTDTTQTWFTTWDSQPFG